MPFSVPTLVRKAIGNIIDPEDISRLYDVVSLLDGTFTGEEATAVQTAVEPLATPGAANQELVSDGSVVTWRDKLLFDVRDGGVTGPDDGDAADNHAALLATISAASAVGGTVVLPPLLPIDDAVVFSGVSVVGQGKDGSTIKATHADARLDFGVTQVGGASEHLFANWAFDGNDTATRGITVHVCNSAAFDNIQVHNVDGYPFILANVQNSIFSGISLSYNTYGGWLTDGCGSNVFVMPQWNDNEYWQCKIGNADGSDPAITHDSTTGYTEPTGNMFLVPMFEWIGNPPTSNSVACVLNEGGSNNVMVLARLIPPSGYARPAIKVRQVTPAAESTLDFLNLTMIGDPSNSVGIDIDGGKVRFIGPSNISGAVDGIKLNGSNSYIEALVPPVIANVSNKYTFSGGASTNGNLTQYRDGYMQYIQALSAYQTLVRYQMPGEGNIRFEQDAAGKLSWGGGSGSPDTFLGRVGSGMVGNQESAEKILSRGGFANGNAADATTPGTVVKKLPWYNDSGTLIGYVAVYDAIT